MTESGVKCVAEVSAEFEKLSKKHSYRYIMFKINDEKTNIVVDKVGEKDESFEDFKRSFPKDQCRYGVFDFSFETKEGQTREKIIFVSLSPDNCPNGREKMLYSSTKKALTDKLGSGSIYAKFHYGDHSDIDCDEIKSELKSKTK